MKITAIEAIPFSIPLSEPIKWGASTQYSVDHVLVKIKTDEGFEGIGEAAPRPTIYGDTQISTYAVIKDMMAPAIIGEDPFNVENIWKKISLYVWNPTAKGAIDVALYDLMGKVCNVPCYKMLGGYKEKIALSWMVSQNPFELVMEEIKRKNSEGVRAFKIKGGQDADLDIRICTEARKMLGKDATIYLDANMIYNFKDAVKVMRALEDVLDYIEEPLPSWDSASRKKLANMVTLPILGDESIFTVQDVVREIELGALRLMMVKIPRTGFTLSRKIVTYGEMNNMPMLTGTQSETTLGATACCHFACGHKQLTNPCENIHYQNIMGSLLQKDPEVIDGYMYVPKGPGLGIALDDDKVKHYSVDLGF
jgi:L-alanine-DL-glutamate epimerase-like enolase superfamily enzyme